MYTSVIVMFNKNMLLVSETVKLPVIVAHIKRTLNSDDNNDADNNNNTIIPLIFL